MMMMIMIMVVVAGRGNLQINVGSKPHRVFLTAAKFHLCQYWQKDKGTYVEKSILNLTSLKPETLDTEAAQHIGPRQ